MTHEIPTSMTAARSAKARLYANDPNPPKELADLVATNLACVNIDNFIRKQVANAGAPMNGSQTAHLVGLLLAEAHVPGSTVTLVESMVREAVASTGEDQ